MRVIAGKYRGKCLNAPSGDSVRPTTDRIKETIFNILQPYTESSVVLDLFAGSGALGIEALSRGAEFVDFVDVSEGSLSYVRQNLKGIDEKTYKVIKSDYRSFLNSTEKKYDLVFIDAPYKGDMGQNAVKTVVELDLLNECGMIVYEHATENAFELCDEQYSQRTKKMGNTTAEFIERL
ncbi:MAG: 16S rRNA (guanine(966)-N(2))-methyltransferase RsmD [Christensenellales bacterium]